MKKIKQFSLLLLSVACVINVYGQYNITGPTCVDVLNENVFYTCDGTQFKGYTYEWTTGAYGQGYFSNGQSDITTTVNYVNIKFSEYYTDCYIDCTVYDSNNLMVDFDIYNNINVLQPISEITGTTLIAYSTPVAYSIVAVASATSYTWTLPTGWSGSSTTNSIVATPGTNPSSGNISVTVNGSDLCNETSKTLEIIISSCYGHAGSYDAHNITSRTVTGDFDRDGVEDDIAAFYRYGANSAKIHVWKSGVTDFDYMGNAGWYSTTSLDLDNVVGMVSGDFDRDGYVDDIAIFVDLGDNNIKLLIYRGTGSAFWLTTTNGWWSSTDYNAQKIKGRIVSGDFDRDGKFDDIAAFYDYDNSTTKIHVWTSTGNSMSMTTSNPWWASASGNYNANRITGRVISGDFDRDGKHDDIAAFYYYDNNLTKLHIFRGATSYIYLTTTNGWWSSTSYDATKITNRVVSGDFDRDGKFDDIAVFYEYPNFETRLHLWKSTGSSMYFTTTNGYWSSTDYDATKLTGRLISGDFDRDDFEDDIAGFYDYTNSSIALHVWRPNPTLFTYAGDDGWWYVCNPIPPSKSIGVDNKNENYVVANRVKQSVWSNDIIQVYPNPSKGCFTLETQFTDVNIDVYSLTGQNVYSAISEGNSQISLDLSNLAKGIYILNVSDGIANSRVRIVIQ